MSIISKKVLPVKAMLSMSLSIPSYQRPYKWQDKHVNQLLDDVIFHRGKSSYRLGTIVLHKDEQEGQLNIVDGQQRLLTLTLLSVLLDKERSFRPKLLEQTFDSAMTQENLRHNAAVIESRTKQLSESDREALVDFVQQKCQLITVTLNDLSEAFQFFDSQNARGKALEPYDLLKAFHLREMVDNTEDERTLCVADWESSITPDNNVSDKGQRENLPSLHTIMSDYLFRLRCWSDVQPGRWFTRHHIDVFKGVNLNQNKYPLAAAMRALDYQVDHYNQDRVRQWDQHKMGYPFQVNQTLLNGKRFFEYVQHYITLYKTLFIDDKPELAALLKTINNYEGRSRKGDHYVRNLFYCAVMFYYDRFGDEALESAATICFLWSYRIRLEQHRVVIESIDNHAREPDGLISTIKRALHHNQVLSYPIAPLEETFVKNKSTKVEGLIAKFKDLRCMQ
ncbi:DUF262 domain-containing protein [Endozoicomonas sp. 4G]|uniref:DUF262 domain-containing protein n=1 Tax=Endozoicomonas sp. 4G TaxID=2872754 RepID=UPI002078CC16|nr:DUF262 domain-containing protein [Endozoicomonas sp. 4G]